MIRTIEFLLITLIFIFVPWHSHDVARGDDVVKLYLEHKARCEPQSTCGHHAVIFIHGIMGSKDTWQDGSSYWPDLIASDPTAEVFDIYRVDYATGILTGKPISEIRQSLINAMGKPPAMKQYKTIQFIAHSLGGIIARDYLLQLKLKGHWALNQFRQLILIGSPADGSYLSKVASIISRNPQLRILRPVRENDYLDLLNESWEVIMGKRGEGGCPSIFLQLAYEEEAVVGVGTVVSKESATALHRKLEGGPITAVKGFPRNHINIVKPRDTADPVYEWVNQSILSCVAGHHSGPCPNQEDIPIWCQRPPANRGEQN